MAVNYSHHINNDKIHIMQHCMRILFFSIELYILIEKAYSDKYTEDHAYIDMPFRRSFLCFGILIISRSLALDLWLDTLYGSTVSTTVSKRTQRTIIIID